MPVMDEFKEEREALKSASFKKKFAYFLDYYKWATIGVVFGLILLVWMIRDFSTRKDTALYVAMMNMSAEVFADEVSAEFESVLDVDTEKEMIVMDTTMEISDDGTQAVVSSVQKFVIYVASGDVDVAIGDETAIGRYAYTNFYEDLRNIYTSDELAALEGKLYYIDLTTLEEKTRLEEEARGLMDVVEVDIPDPYKPELMDRPVPVGIVVDGSEILKKGYKAYRAENGRVIASFILSSQKKEKSKTFVDYIYNN